MVVLGTHAARKQLGRYGYRLAQLSVDAGALAVAFVLAYLIRFDWLPDTETLDRLLLQTPYVVLLEVGLLYAHGARRLVWRFIALRDLPRLAEGVLLATLLLLVVRGIASSAAIPAALVPLGVIAINAVLAYAGVVGVRILRRTLYERRERLGRTTPAGLQRVLLVGAGRAGQLAAREIAGRPDLGLHMVGFLDDDPVKIGTRIQGIDVLGSTVQLPELVQKHEVDQVVLTMAQVEGAVVRRIVEACKVLGVPLKVIPGLYEILGGRVSVSRLRDVEIEDLLGRDPVELDIAAIRSFMQHKVLVVTGAGGSIGSEICRQVAAYNPQRLVLVDRFENALFEIHGELARSFPDVLCEPRVADVADRRRVERVLAEFGCDVLFHAAAHKHVPMMEWNPSEAVKNNVGGTQALADLAHAFGVGHFVLISTDKAVNPASVMGASKRVAELYVQAMAQRSQTIYVSVRFGNVLGSAGSVIPTFKRQIAAGGPVTVTHPEMCRYFMTIPEATQLVLEAATLGRGGEVFILDMGKPVRIVDLARDLIALSGLEPGDIEICFTGLRPGEKLFEMLSTAEENAVKTRHPKIFIGRLPPVDLRVVTRQVQQLLAVADSGDHRRIREELAQIVPEYRLPATSRWVPGESTVEIMAETPQSA